MNNQEWTTEYTPHKGWFDLHFRELWRYRGLILLLVRRDFITVYKQTVLGPVWFILQPVASTLIFTLVFGKIIGVSTQGIPQPLFYLSGVVVWNYFSNCLIKTSDILTANTGLFGKVYFPRLIIPISVIIVNFITFLMQFSLFSLVLFYYSMSGEGIALNLSILIFPLLVLLTALLGLAVGLIVSSLTTKYRDLSFLTSFAVQLWMYATPIVYPLSMVPQDWRWLFHLNPMVAVVDSFRHAFLGVGTLDWEVLAMAAFETGGLLFLSLIVFSRVEKTFMDTV